MKKLGFAIIFLLLFFSLSASVCAVTLDNNGNAMDNPYGDCKATSSFTNAQYYDCYVPYNVTIRDIGGWSNGVIAYAYSTYNYSMQSYYPNRIDTPCFSYVINGYMPMSSGWHGATVTAESTGAQIFTDRKGNQYYGMAIQQFFYASGKEGSNNFPVWNSGGMLGQLVDVILTDGTCIHFVILDANDSAHTNGGPMETSLWNVQYSFSEMKNNTYKHLFHAAFGNCIELAGTSWGSGTTELMKKYNLGKDGNKIAYYRMYNVKIDDSPERDPSVGKEVSYSLGDVTISQSNSNQNNPLSAQDDVLIPEDKLRGMPQQGVLSNGANSVSLPSNRNLSSRDKSVISEVKTNIRTDSEETWVRNTRILISLIGMLMILYVVFLYIAYAFDYANVFFDISLLKLVSFGLISLDSKGMNSEKKFYLNKLHRVAIVLFIVGIVLISGSVNMWIFRLVRFIQDKLG